MQNTIERFHNLYYLTKKNNINYIAKIRNCEIYKNSNDVIKFLINEVCYLKHKKKEERRFFNKIICSNKSKYSNKEYYFKSEDCRLYNKQLEFYKEELKEIETNFDYILLCFKIKTNTLDYNLKELEQLNFYNL